MTLDRLGAPIFVVLWSTGFVSAKLGLPYAEPMSFLALRFGAASALLALWLWWRGAQRLTRRQITEQALIGALVHFVYLGGVFVAISWGTEAGVAALIVGLQPVLTAILAGRFLAERLVPVQWLGMALGVAGVGVVVLRKLDAGIGDPAGIAVCCVGLAGVAIGTILQKRTTSQTPMLAGNAVQFAAASACCLLVALIFESQTMRWEPPLIIAMSWSIVVLSLGAISLLYFLIRHGAASHVASLFFLVPPCTALMAWALFGETLGKIELAGIAATAIGVLLVNRPGLVSRRAEKP